MFLRTCLIIPMFRCSYPLSLHCAWLLYILHCAWLLYILHANNVEIQVGLNYRQVGETGASCYNFIISVNAYIKFIIRTNKMHRTIDVS